MRTKKKTVEQKKNRNSQKSVKSVRLMGMGGYGGKDFWKRYERQVTDYDEIYNVVLNVSIIAITRHTDTVD